MSCVIFENAGEIDPLLIKTFGVSVKEGDSPIGFFGTGLKYALAILLRTGHEISIQSGERTHAFGTKQATLRGQPFNLITMDGDPLGFTDAVGKTWDLWMAYRELYCNAKDEGGDVYIADDLPAPKADVTRVVVKGDAFLTEHNRRSTFILIGDPLYELEGCNVHAGECSGIFYRGMLVNRLPTDKRSRYTWNLTRHIELTEDRTAKHPILIPMFLAAAVIGAGEEDFIRDLITLPNSYYEHHLNYSTNGVWGAERPGQAFIQAAKMASADRRAALNPSAAGRYKDEARATLKPETTPLRGVEAEMLRRAIAFCDNLGFPVEKYPIVVTDTLGPGTLGLAADSHIYVARHAFMQGTKRLCATLIEEYIHLKYGFADETRAFEDFLIDRLVSLGEEMHGEPL